MSFFMNQHSINFTDAKNYRIRFFFLHKMGTFGLRVAQNCLNNDQVEVSNNITLLRN